MSVLKWVTPRRLFTAGLAIFVCCCVFIMWPVYVASKLQIQLHQMHEGPLSMEQLRNWASQHGSRLACSAGRCEATAVVRNRLLWRLHLAPATDFIAGIVEENGKLVETQLWLTDISYMGRRRGSRTLLIVDYGYSRIGASQSTEPRISSGPQGKAPTVTYRVSSAASAGDLELAFDLNVWCLARIGGCEAEQQAPRIWVLRREQLEHWARQPHAGAHEDP